MELNQDIVIKGLSLVGLCVVGYFGMRVMQKFGYVKSSVGWNFIDTMGQVKNSKKYDLALRVKSPAGKEYYLPVKQSTIIKYPYFENGNEVEKRVIYDERALDYLNGIPILNVTPRDIRPVDRETGLLVNIPSEIINKLAVDSSKTAEGEEKHSKERKMLIYTIIGMAILFIIALSYINQTNAELQQQLAKVTIESIKSATVVAG